MSVHQHLQLRQRTEFARCKAESQYPEAWDGLVGDMVPLIRQYRLPELAEPPWRQGWRRLAQRGQRWLSPRLAV